jgi:SRSO17 transposase
MPVVPSSLDALLFLFRDAFSAPTFRTFRLLMVGFLCRIGEHSVCGMLQAARLERVWHHSRAHAFFSERKWCPDELGLLLLDFLVATFVATGAPIRLAVDDSLFHRSGKHVYGAAWQYDGSVPQGAGHKSGYGNNWVSLCVIVRLPFMRRAVGLTVLSRLWRPDPDAKRAKAAGRSHKPSPEYPSKPGLAREMLDLVIARFPQRAVELVGDSAYATKAFAGLPERVSVTSRLKANAQLYAPTPPRTGKRGQPAKKGKRLGKLAAIAADPKTVWERTEVTRSGKHQEVLCHSFEALWYDVWGQRPVRVVLVKASKRTEGYDIALITLDIHASAAQIIERYDERWAIEVSYEDAKQITGVGQARNRVQKAVQRTVPFGFLAQTIAITWYALYGQAEQDVQSRRRRSPWYSQKRFPSYQDMLSSLRRAVIAAQYQGGTPRRSIRQEIPNSASALKTAAG